MTNEGTGFCSVEKYIRCLIEVGAGESFIPKGEPTKAYTRLKTKLASFGLHVVPVGELESFCKSIGTHGPAWVIESMKRDLTSDTELTQARKFVETIFWP